MSEQRTVNPQAVIASLIKQRNDAHTAFVQLLDRIAEQDGIIAAQDAEIAALKAAPKAEAPSA